MPAGRLFNLRVLVVEDDADARASLEDLARRSCDDVCGAENGLAALKVLETFQADLVICDISMPQMDGFEFARRAREKYRTRCPYLVSFSGLPVESAAIAAGFDVHLHKGSDAKKILSLFEEASTRPKR